jgi:hypothetical protein
VSEVRPRGVETCGEDTAAPAGEDVERMRGNMRMGPLLASILGPLLARGAPRCEWGPCWREGPQDVNGAPAVERGPKMCMGPLLSRMPPLAWPQEPGSGQGTPSAADSDMTSGRLF